MTIYHYSLNPRKK